jgi:hypothetical protein
MAVTKVIELVTQLDDKGLKELETGLKKVEVQQNKVSKTSKDTGKNISDNLGDAGDAADNLSGGVSGIAAQFKVVSKAAKTGGKAMKTALISTGVGALVVALGLVVEHWEEIGIFLGFINKDLENQHELLSENLGLLNSELSLLEKQMKFNEQRGISNEENLKLQKELLKEKKLLLFEDIKILEAQLLKEQSAAAELSTWQKLQIAMGTIPRDLTLIDPEERERLNELRKQILKLKEEVIVTDDALDPVSKKAKASAREKEKVIGGSLTAEEQAEELSKMQRQFEERFEVKLYEQEQLNLLGKDGLNAALNDDNVLLAKKKENADNYLIYKKVLNAQELEMTKQTLGNITEVLGTTSAAGKAVAVASALINTYQGITAELATKTTTPFEFGLKLVNIASVVGIGFKAVKDIVSTKLPSFAGSSGGSGGGGSSSAPSFNVVGTSGVNQIAQSLSQEQDPIQAYVVGSNVTTQQALDRNILDTATIG